MVENNKNATRLGLERVHTLRGGRDDRAWEDETTFCLLYAEHANGFQIHIKHLVYRNRWSFTLGKRNVKKHAIDESGTELP